MLDKNLEKFFIKNKKVALGFSGGVDSAYLLYAGIKSGADIKAYYIKSYFQPSFELEDAKRLVKDLGANMEIIELDVLSNDNIKNNPKDRCYYCKERIFSTLIAKAQEDGYSLIIDGTNASDEYEDRPGMKALKELSVCSPLREVGLTKDKIRKLSKEAGLFTWNKAAYACLATRIPTNETITKDLLKAVEGAEGELFSLGFSNFRIRVFNKAARVQVDGSELMNFIENREIVLEKLKKYFSIVLLDLEVR